VSVHFYCDLIHAIATTKCEPSEFHLLTLLYESLCYQENNVSYPRIA
jgi:hypothetical protein